MNVKVVVILLIGCASCAALSSALDKEWKQYKQVHGKAYSGMEDQRRRIIWEQNVKKVAAHNRLYDMGLESYTLAVNKFADQSYEEFIKTHASYRPPTVRETRPLYVASSDADLPEELDWRDQNVVTAVKDQEDCGGCWAFSAIASLESQVILVTGSQVLLSEQNLLDCSTQHGNAGCDGGFVDGGYKYIQNNGGVDTEQSYPFIDATGVCSFNESNIGAKISLYTGITEYSEDDLQDAVVNVGPIAVCIDATDNFQLYSEGVFNDNTCKNKYDLLNHCVLAAGYGVDDGSDYWLVKNSWGTSWGEEGYIRMARNKDNQCGIATDSWYPTLKTSA